MKDSGLIRLLIRLADKLSATHNDADKAVIRYHIMAISALTKGKVRDKGLRDSLIVDATNCVNTSIIRNKE